MRKEEFEVLNFHGKITLLFERGEEIAFRRSEGYEIKLYQLQDFFCEIWYNSEANQIHNVCLIDTKDIIALYPINLGLSDII